MSLLRLHAFLILIKPSRPQLRARALHHQFKRLTPRISSTTHLLIFSHLLPERALKGFQALQVWPSRVGEAASGGAG